MRPFALGLVSLLMIAGAVSAQQEPLEQATFRPRANPNCPPSTYPTDPAAPTPLTDSMQQGQPNLFAGATEAGTQPGTMFNANMFGDLIGISSTQRLVLGRGTSLTTVRGLPVTGRYNGFKVTDNDNPRPSDRVFFNYNGYSAVNKSQLGAGVPNVNMNQEVLGFEKTFLQGDASFGVRLPFIQISGFSAVEAHVVGDLSIHAKFAWVNNRQTGNVVSTGLIVTTPTGGGTTILSDGSEAPHSVLIQPWAGWVYNMDRFYLQGFHSLVVPLDNIDPTILFNSISAGYWLYRSNNDRLLQGVVPVVELHLNTPLNQSSNDLIFFNDQLNVTVGSYFVFPRMTFGGAVGIPLVGPKPYDIEALASVNFRF